MTLLSSRWAVVVDLPRSSPSENVDKHDLSDSDLARLEEMAKDKDRRTWLFGSIKRTAVWIGAVGAAVSYGWQAVERIAAWLKGHP